MIDYNFDKYLSEPLPFDKEIDLFFRHDDKLIIFEIGACEGEDSIKIRRKYPNAQIYVFEPLPKNISRMKRNYKKYGADAIHINQLALSNRSGTAEFHVSSGHPNDLPKTPGWDFGNKSSSLLAPKEHIKIHDWVKFKQKIKVKTKRLDEFCKEHFISKIDFMFLDVQGAELMVLEGAGSFLGNVTIIWMEVEAVELYANQPLKNDVEKFMRQNGFEMLKDTVNNVAGDQLYVNKKHMSRKSIGAKAFRNFIKIRK